MRAAAAAFRLFFLILCSSCVPSFAAEVRVTLPLEGHYRAGRYLPVRVEVRGAAPGAVLRLTGEGVIPTHVETVNGRADGVAPVLPLTGGLRELRWSLGDETGVVETPLRAMGDGQRLVGFTSSLETDLGRQLFPGETVIAVRVDPAELAVERWAGWQGLDAVVVEAGVWSEGHVASLASAGVAVARRATDAGASPGWERVGSYHVWRAELLGPQRAGVLPSAFAPVQGWRAELPRAFRMRVLLLGVLVAIAVLGAGLLRGRWRVVLIVGVAVLATWSLRQWWRGMSPVLSRVGAVWAVNDGARAWQSDTWAYRATVNGAEVEQPWVTMTLPLFEREEDVAAMGMRLECSPDGKPLGFRYRLAPRRTMGWLQRAVRLGAPVESLAPVRGVSPMDRLAQRMYLTPGYLRAGIVPESSSASLLTEVYPTTVIRRGPRTTTSDGEPRMAR